MNSNKKSLYLLSFFLFFLGWINIGFTQDFLPKLNRVSAIQKDTSNFYFKEIWIQSKDVNDDDAYGYTKRASDKIQMGYYQQAISDIDKSISLDSTISYNFTLKGFCWLKEDSNLLAIEYFNKAKAINDTDASNYFYLGETDWQKLILFITSALLLTVNYTMPILEEQISHSLSADLKILKNYTKKLSI